MSDDLRDERQREAERNTAERLIVLLRNRGVDSLRIHVEALKVIKEVARDMKKEKRL